MAKWFPSWASQGEDEDKDKGRKDKKDELPPELEARFRTVDELKTSVASMDEKLKGLDSITAFFTEMKTEKEKEKAELERKKKAKTPEQQATEDENLAVLILEDPKKAISDITAPQTQALMMLMASNKRREVFEDRASDFPYYTGEIKAEIDRILSGQPLAFQNSIAGIENTYYTVVGKKQKDISENKIKNRFAPAGGNTKGTDSQDKDNVTFDITPDIIRAAKLSGMETADYMKLLEKAAKVGEIEYV